jgi:cytoskeletal protein CcmA (bactofilin family)
VVVCGTFLGEVDIAGPLTLSATGRMEADVEVQSARIAGKARGTMRASSRIRLDATARFEGEIATPVIELRPGSVLRGRASILGRRDTPAVR